MVQTIPKWQIYDWAYHMADFLLGLPHIREVLVITRGYPTISVSIYM
jgi:hypothetical protein